MTHTLKDIANKIADIDFTMLSTRTDDGQIAARPMSNNSEVEYDGDSWFFVTDDTRTVADIRRDPHVGLSLQGNKGLLGKPPLFISIEGKAELIDDKAEFRARWHKHLDHWYKDGPDTPGLLLIKVHATRITWWDGEEQDELVLG